MWIVLALGSATLASFAPIINKRLLVSANVPVVVWAGQTAALPVLGVSVVLFPTVSAWLVASVAQVVQHWRGFLLLGLIGGLAPLMGYTAFSLGLVGYVSALFKLSTIFTLAWAFFLLDERDVISRLPGAATMVVGGLLIAS